MALGDVRVLVPRGQVSYCLRACLASSRCYTKTNGTFSGGTLPLMHRVAPCQQDGLEMVPLGQASSHGQRPDSQQLLPGDADPDPEAGEQPLEDRDSSHSLSQLSCCQVGVHEDCSREDTGEISRRDWKQSD